MAEPATVADLIRSLRTSDRINVTADGDDSETIRLRLIDAEPGEIVAVDEEIYWYFLEVLPPRWQRGGQFCFAEGSEPFIYFWRPAEEAYFARRLTDDETTTFCRLAGINRYN